MINWLDISFVIALAIFVTIGIKRGLVQELLGIIGFILALICAINFSQPALLWLRSFLQIPTWISSILVFFLIFLVVYLAVKLLAWGIHKLGELILLGWLDRLGGAVFGIIKGTFLMSIFFLILSFAKPVTPFVDTLTKNSQLFPLVKGFAPMVFNLIKGVTPHTDEFYKELSKRFSQQ